MAGLPDEGRRPSQLHRARVVSPSSHTSASARMSNPSMLTARLMKPMGGTPKSSRSSTQRRSVDRRPTIAAAHPSGPPSPYTRIPSRSMAVPSRMPTTRHPMSKPPGFTSASSSVLRMTKDRELSKHLQSLRVFPWGIRYRNWLFCCFDSRPIAGESELDEIAKQTRLLHSLPEMVFARNFLRVEYVHSEEVPIHESTADEGEDYKLEEDGDLIVKRFMRMGKRINVYFTAKDSLRSCFGRPKKPVLVSQSKQWQRRAASLSGSEGGSSSLNGTSVEIDRNMDADYDWTFSTSYSGTYHRVDFVEVECAVLSKEEGIMSESSKNKEEGSVHHRTLFEEHSVDFIPDSPFEMNRVLLMDTSQPILWQCQLCLFEDELHDCGTSELHLRCRVMGRCFLIRMRQFLRVDRVLLRVRDTRLFHEFGQPWLLRCVEWRESHWSDLHSFGLGNDPALYNSDSIDRFVQSIPVVHSSKEHINL